MKKLVTLLLAVGIASATMSVAQGQNSSQQSSKTNTATTGKKAQTTQQPVKTEKVSYTCPMHPAVASDKPGKCPDCKMNLVVKEAPAVQYTCPMHPEIVKDKPGKCPKCGMNLTKKEAKKPNKE